MRQTSKALAYAAQETAVNHSGKQILLLCPVPKYHPNVFIFHHWERALPVNTAAAHHKLALWTRLDQPPLLPRQAAGSGDIRTCLLPLFTLKIRQLYHNS